MTRFMSEQLLQRKLDIAKQRIELLEKMIEEKTRQLYLEHVETVAAKERMSTILDTMQSSVIVVGTDGLIQGVNQALVRQLGEDEATLVGSPLDRILRHRPKGDSSGSVGQVDAEPLTPNTGSYLITRSASRIPVLVSDAPLIDADDNLFGQVFVCQDMTDYKALEGQLLQSQKLESVGQLAAGIAHEINTPIQFVGDNTHFLGESFGELAAILNKAADFSMAEEQAARQALGENLAESIKASDLKFLMEEIPKAIEQTLDGVSRVAKIVRAMKEFAHPGSSQKQGTDLNRLIESTVTVSTNEWKYVADLRLELDQTLQLVPCLPGELSQVILNMVVNSAHSIEDKFDKGKRGKGLIRISTRLEGLNAVIEISDNGNGIPPEVLNRIYDPFFTTKGVGRGTGQGLSIAHSVVVDKHRGSIDCRSTVGEGATFVIHLPINQQMT